MSKISSETPEQRLQRAQSRSDAAVAAHKAAKAAGGIIPSAVAREAATARTALRREQVGPETWDRAQAWGASTVVDRAKRLVSTGREDKTGHGPMAVVSHAQFAELQQTGTIKGGAVHIPPPTFPS
jgi:hypothetical protein